MPLVVRLNLCPEFIARFGDEGVDQALNIVAQKGAQIAQGKIGSAGNPSAPGEPPGNRTGNLQQSIHADGTSMVADAGYADFLEQGTRKMAPRPWFLTSATEAASEVENAIRSALGL